MPLRKAKAAHHGDGGGPQADEQLCRRLDTSNTRSRRAREQPAASYLLTADGAVIGIFGDLRALRAAQLGQARQ
jgi:hypothetical protein